MRIDRYKGKNKGSIFLKIFISMVVIVGISFAIAWVWHSSLIFQSDEAISSASSNTDIIQEKPSVQPLVNSEADDAQPPDAGIEDGASQADLQKPPALDGAVPESDPVDQSYFDDAIFFGDSISTGIPLYHLADNAAVVAMPGINTNNVNNKKVIDIGEEERVTFLEAAKTYGPRKKVYIMLGGNGLSYEKEVFIGGYKKFLDSVKALYPDAIIYLQSMTPVTADYVNDFDPDFSNEKLDAYNLEILALAKREKVYYLDVSSALKDESGALPKEASPLDGLHFSPEYYNKWFEYLKTHTVEVQ